MIGSATIDLGPSSIDIPIARLRGEEGGKTLFITAGMDGDEYAGMEASYRLIEEFSKKPFQGQLIIIPIVNIPGFRVKTSENPMDGKFPKHIYPGNKNGTPTERLCFWVSGFAQTADFWLDMHGGAMTETLTPFVHAWTSGNKIIDSFVESIVRSVSSQFAVLEFSRKTAKTKALAKIGCGYLFAESGELGRIEENAVNQHILWSHQVMSLLGMIDQKIAKFSKTIFDHVDEYTVRHDGIWRPKFSSCQQVEKGTIIGEVRSPASNVIKQVCAKEDGQILWLTIGSEARKGDIVAGIGSTS